MRQFSDQHIAALTVMVLSAGASVWAARGHPGHWLVSFSRGLGLVILAGWAGEYVGDVVLGIWTVQYGLPLQLTDAVSAVAVLALLASMLMGQGAGPKAAIPKSPPAYTVEPDTASANVPNRFILGFHGVARPVVASSAAM